MRSSTNPTAALSCRTARPRVGSHVQNRVGRSVELRPRAYKQPQADVVSAPAEPGLEQCVNGTQASLNLWQRYCLSLEKNPATTKAITSFSGFCIGDVLAQTLEGDPFDVARLIRLGAYGLLLDGPIGHMWYRWLDGTVDKKLHKNPKGAMAVGVKTAADQLIWAPVMTVVFFAFLKLLEGQPDLVWATVAEKTLPTVAANYLIWPAAHIISFRYIPSQQRILYNNSVAIFWNCYLSLVAADSNTPSDSPGSSSWSWDAYSFWVGLPGGLDPAITSPFTEMYHNVQSALGIQPEPVTVPASALTQMYHRAQSSLGMHAHTPEPVSGLQGLAQGFWPLWGAAAAAPRDDGLLGQLQAAVEMADRAHEALQGGMHESMLVGSFWMNHVLQEASKSAVHSQDTVMAIFDSISHLHSSLP